MKRNVYKRILYIFSAVVLVGLGSVTAYHLAEAKPASDLPAVNLRMPLSLERSPVGFCPSVLSPSAESWTSAAGLNDLSDAAATPTPQPTATLTPEPTTTPTPEMTTSIKPEPVITTQSEPAATTVSKPAATPTPQPTPTPTPEPTPTPAPQWQAEILYHTNQARIAAGLQPLQEGSRALNQAAVQRAGECAVVYLRDQTLSHDRPDGECFSTVLAENDVSYRLAGENLFLATSGTHSAETVVNRWLESEGHRANIMNDRFSQLGVGVYHCSQSGLSYFVQIFIG